jgi:uroporphyrinogen decarboxylase
MSIRERFFKAMRRKGEGFVPFEFSLCPSLHEEFIKRFGCRDYAEYFQFPARGFGVPCTVREDRFDQYYINRTGISVWKDWGVGDKKGSVAHFTEMQHPMRGFETLGEFAAYPYPDPVKDYDWSSVPGTVKAIQDRDLIAVACMEITIFEIAWYLRGMDNFLIDLIMNPELAIYHLDRITAIRCEMAGRYAAAGSDVLRLGDDVSTQLDMMMNPDTWREFIKPRLARVILAAREAKPDILVFYHGDGNLQKIIPDLIEVGVDILNPIQPECMDPVEIKNTYGDRLSFWGTIGTQSTMPFGTPQEVREACMRMIGEVGNGGGLFLAPTHVVEPEVPWENIQAFIDTVQEYNRKNS